jgi:serine/threonine-protein kinase
LYLAEEYIRGIDLKERIRRVAPFSLTVAVDVALALAEALEFAHARGVVHGDIRPQNVLVGPEGQIKLTGFGTAGAQALLADPSTLMRTVPYAAPEVAAGRTASTSGDIYALGVVLFEMLTGDPPFDGDGPIQVALKHAQEPVPSPRASNPGVPRALEGIVLKALHKRPDERYASPSVMLADLRQVRDALRHGKSLSWSPLDAADREEVGTVAAALPGRGTVAGAAAAAADATVVMPVAAGRAPRRPGGGDGGGGAAAADLASSRGGAQEREVAAIEQRRRWENRWLTSLNLFMLALVLAGLAALAYMTVYFVKPPEEVVVPNLVGKSLAEAEALASQNKFVLAKVEERHRDKEPEGTIFQMKPEAGRHIREGKPVSVWISKGPQLVEVPDVRDMSLERARRLIEGKHLRIGDYTSEFDPLTAKGNVLSQDPAPGENRRRGSRVALVLSKGEEPPPPPVVIPEEPLPADPGTGTEITPGGDLGDAGSGDTGDGERIRTFSVSYDIPRDNQPHRIRIDVTDKDGTRTVYDEPRQAGERVKEEIEAVGRRVTIKFYDNDELRKEVPL